MMEIIKILDNKQSEKLKIKLFLIKKEYLRKDAMLYEI